MAFRPDFLVKVLYLLSKFSKETVCRSLFFAISMDNCRKPCFKNINYRKLSGKHIRIDSYLAKDFCFFNFIGVNFQIFTALFFALYILYSMLSKRYIDLFVLSCLL